MVFMSPRAVDYIKIELRLLLAIPTTTRWNSVYDAVCRLKTSFENREKRAALDQVCNTEIFQVFLMIFMLCLNTFFNCKIFIIFNG